ncbi:MAG: OadG family protein [Muribaculaceae bacterium]|nr:OadG family protein [Muribaculaceae bacterium]
MNKKILLTLIAVVAAITASAQGRLDLRINEVMVQNNSDYVDQDGPHSAWIEIFNASYGTNGIEKMFITTLNKDFINNKLDGVPKSKTNQVLHKLCETNNGEIYEIPLGDEATKVKPRSHVLFFADGDTTAGTFHLPFTLSKGQYVALYDVNGDLVDEVMIPDTLQANQSFARIKEDDLHKKRVSRDFNKDEWEVRDGSSVRMAITPGKYNTRPINDNIQKFKEEDSYGWKLTLMSMGVVFSALLLLYILFKIFGKIFIAKDKKKEDEAVEKVFDEENTTEPQPEGDDEAIAAICMALYQHFNAHDEESGVLTFDRSQQHGAWGSKGNLLRRRPEKH